MIEVGVLEIVDAKQIDIRRTGHLDTSDQDKSNNNEFHCVTSQVVGPGTWGISVIILLLQE
jgi:hypothetical protein